MATNQISTSPYLLSDANQATYNYGQLPPDQALEEQALNRRQHIANLLIQQGLANAGANHGQMVGRFYVPGSPVQNLAGLASIAAGAYGTYKGDQARQGLTQKSNDMLAEAVEKYKRATSDVPEVAADPRAAVTQAMAPQVDSGPPPPQSGTYGLAPKPIPNNVNFGLGEGLPLHPMTGAPLAQTDIPPITKPYQMQPEPAPTMSEQGPVSPGSPARPRTPEEKRQAIVDLMASQHPQAARLGQLLQTMQENQAKHAEDLAVRREGITANTDLRKSTIESNALNTQALIDSKERMGQDANDLKKQLADQQAELKRLEIGAQKEARETGKTPQGYRATKDGLEPIPGGPADVKQQGVFNTDTAMLQSTNAAMDRLASTANQLLNHPGLAGITGVRGKVPDIPGSDAANARALLQTLKAEVGFAVMQDLRNNSKSGSSGLGALSDAEGKRLENNLAALDTTQGLDQFKAQLKNGVLDYAQGAKDRLRDTFNMKHKQGAPIPMTPSTGKGPAAGTVEGGYKFKGGDPGKAENWEKQ